MSKTIDRIEDASVNLDTILGLLQATDDLLTINISLLYDYPSNDNDEKKRARHLADELLALVSASIQITKETDKKIEKSTDELLKGGVR